MTSLRILFALLLLIVWSSADAQILDRIEINRIGKEAEIRIRFTTEIQYLRHVPLEQGKLLRVFFRLTNPQIVESDLPQETLTSPATDLVPRFTVTYPELTNGMLINFSQSMQFKVRPGVDARSIAITVPALPGAKDVSVEERVRPVPALAQQAAQPVATVPITTGNTVGQEFPRPAQQPVLPEHQTPQSGASVLGNKGAQSVVPIAAKEVSTPQESNPSSKQPAANATVSALIDTPADKPAAAVAPAPAAPIPAPTQLAAEATPKPSSAPVQNAQLPQAETKPAPPLPSTTATGVADAGVMPPPPVLSSEEIERLAKKFLAEARKAMDDKDMPKAINRLNRTLGLPPNSQTEAAQALIGQARELNGEIAKAKAEYELFLKVFPNSGEVPRIKERLAALPKQAPRQAGALARTFPKDPGPAKWTVFGSFAQYWYHGQSHIETTTPPPPGQLTFNTDTLSLTDQDSLISSLDFNARRRDAVSDTRIVLRYIDNHNYLPRGKGYSRLNSAYFEQTDRQKGYFVRAGRQNPDGGGVLERFDGISLGYYVAPDWRVKAVAGTPVEFGQPYKKQFYGTSLERTAQLEQPGYSFYYLTQTLEGAINRRAVGSDVRYFDSQLTLYGLLDYDLDFKALNIALMQANYRTMTGTNYFAVLDHRKSPSLSLLSVLPAFPGLEVRDILATTSIDQVRDTGKALTAESNLFSIGVTRPFSEKWQFGTDYRLASISGIEGAGLMPAQPGSGNNHVISGQAIGNGIFRPNDVIVANGSYIHSPTYDGEAYGLNYVVQIIDPLRFDTNLRFYTQKDNAGEKQTRLSPSARLTYRFKDRLSLECEAGNEIGRTDGPTRKDRSDRRYMYCGYRWDMR